MIPIGTRCMVVGAEVGEEHWIGKTCVVERYGPIFDEWARGDFADRAIQKSDCLIEFEDGTDSDSYCYSRPEFLIPIGHDPDAETRNVAREVEA